MFFWQQDGFLSTDGRNSVAAVKELRISMPRSWRVWLHYIRLQLLHPESLHDSWITDCLCAFKRFFLVWSWDKPFGQRGVYRGQSTQQTTAPVKWNDTCNITKLELLKWRSFKTVKFVDNYHFGSSASSKAEWRAASGPTTCVSRGKLRRGRWFNR